jgi:hypothetical protein
MINEENYIRSKMGNKNPFTVPEGYFEQLTGDIMSKIPAPAQKEQKPAFIKRLRPLLYAAACVCIAMFGVVVYQNLDKQSNDTLNASISHNAAEYNDKFIDDAADYAMFDNDEIYASLLAEI